MDTQRLKFIIIFPVLLFSGFAFPQAHYTSFRPGEIWKDNKGVHINAHGGGILFYDNTYYWFGEHKVEGKQGNVAQVGVHCYSSQDLYNWADEGISLEVSEDPESDIVRGSIIERPKVIYNKQTKKFVMWFHLELKGKSYTTARSGVAISDYPTGPYTFIKSGRINPGIYPVNSLELHQEPFADKIKNVTHYEGILQSESEEGKVRFHPDTINTIARDLKDGQMARDMTLFVDDDGKAYFIYSSETNTTLHVAELTEDYLSHTGKYVRVFVNRYMEAPAVFKKDNLYYMMASDCTGWKPNPARSAVAPFIWGPWTELGNPAEGIDANITFNSQSTFILPVNGKKDAFIYMGDRWNPQDAIDGRYIWLPIDFEDKKFKIRWKDEWTLDYFNK